MDRPQRRHLRTLADAEDDIVTSDSAFVRPVRRDLVAAIDGDVWLLLWLGKTIVCHRNVRGWLCIRTGC